MRYFAVGNLIGLSFGISIWLLYFISASNTFILSFGLLVWIALLICGVKIQVKGTGIKLLTLKVSKEQNMILRKNFKTCSLLTSGGMLSLALVFVVYELS